MSETIRVDEHDGWAEITLNRPERLNAFNDEMHRALAHAIGQARDRKLRAILLTGAGRGFCAGQDLGDRDPAKLDSPPDLAATLTTFYNPLIRLIRSIEIPVICAVNGVAAGAGANLALACDIVLAAESAKFVQSFASVGLIPDSGGSWFLPRLLGEARAKGLALTAAPLTASRAAEWGADLEGCSRQCADGPSPWSDRTTGPRSNPWIVPHQGSNPGRRGQHTGPTAGA